MTLEIGDYIEFSDWFWDEKSKFVAEGLIAINIAKTGNEMGVDVSDLEFETLEIDDARCPEPPDHGCSLRVGWVRVTRLPLQVSEGVPLSQDLEPKDLAMLRQTTRAAHQKVNPMAPPLTDMQCDAVIDAVGPDTAANQVRKLHS